MKEDTNIQIVAKAILESQKYGQISVFTMNQLMKIAESKEVWLDMYEPMDNLKSLRELTERMKQISSVRNQFVFASPFAPIVIGERVSYGAIIYYKKKLEISK